MKSIICAILLSILPGYAILCLSKEIEAKYIFGYLLTVSCITVLFYRSDKKKAQRDEWRTPESTLHLLELVGGWHAAFFSQRKFRHKISKNEYLFTFWLIALVHNYLAFDYTKDWQYSKAAIEFIKPFMK